MLTPVLPDYKIKNVKDNNLKVSVTFLEKTNELCRMSDVILSEELRVKENRNFSVSVYQQQPDYGL
jgi:hypothetical protein